jgi:sugar diacid utilization regulator
VLTHPLRLGADRVGTLALRARRAPDAELIRLCALLLAAEVRHLRLPGDALRQGAAALLGPLFDEARFDPELVDERARELGMEIASGVGVALIRAHAQSAVDEDWSERCLGACERALGAGAERTLCAFSERAEAPASELIALIGAGSEQELQRVTQAVLDELRSAPATARVVIGSSRLAYAAAELPRAAAEALLAANVAEGEEEGDLALAFEQTGAYRLLLPAMRESAQELERFYAETVAPLLAYDRQYETALVRTLTVFLESDGNVAAAAQRLFTHRHTVYYRLERIKELSALDVASSDGREKLSLGLKAMRVLGISAGSSPAHERSAARGGAGGRSDEHRSMRR